MKLLGDTKWCLPVKSVLEWRIVYNTRHWIRMQLPSWNKWWLLSRIRSAWIILKYNLFVILYDSYFLNLRKVIDDPCFSNPCLNGGTCTQVGDSYSCACTEEYQGTNCDRLITSTTTSTSTTAATSGTTEDREGPTGAPQPPFANISVQDFFGQSCELRFRIIHWMDKLTVALLFAS